MREFEITRDPYGTKVPLFSKKNISINDGVTLLVGTNGSGKTTLIRELEDILKGQDIPVIKFNNLADGGNNNISHFLYQGKYDMAGLSFTSSEGENIILSISAFIPKLKEFLREGESIPEVIKEIRKIRNEEPKEFSKERWILFDATDSGLSIDNAIDLMGLFNLILEDGKKLGLDIYIVVSTNEYEMTKSGEPFDVVKGKYTSFKSYDDFREFVLKSRELKDKRLEKERIKNEY